MRARRPPRVLLAGLLALTATGCVEERRTIGEQCALNSECSAPLVCGLGRCHVACVADRDCPSGARCVLAQNDQGVCLLPDEASCALDSDCPASLVCRSARCVNECAENRDCPPGSVCASEDGAPACEPLGRDRCTRPSDCPAPLVCGASGECRAECRASRDCPRGEVCLGGGCALLAPGVDGGSPDAEVAEAGVGDGGGGLDAGAPPPPFECSVDADCVGSDATLACRFGRCVVVGCPAGRGDCDGDPSNGCEDPLDTAAHCGACDNRCPGPGARCEAAACTRLVELDSGEAHHCARWETGEVYCWGANGDGQLGDGTTTPRETPARVTGLEATDVSAGAEHSCAVRTGGTVACWGRNGDGQLGDGTQMGSLTPVDVVGLPPGDPAVQVSAGARHTCAVLTSGDIWCWGDGDEGRVGDGSTAPGARTSPARVQGGHAWTTVSAGANATCAIRTDGQAMCFGDREDGQLGNGEAARNSGRAEPQEVIGVDDAVAIGVSMSSSFPHACALTRADGLRCWGNGALVGTGAITDRTVAVAPVAPTPAQALAVGGGATCALSFGATTCWGLASRVPQAVARPTARLLGVAGTEVCTVDLDERVRCGEAFSTPSVVPGF